MDIRKRTLCLFATLTVGFVAPSSLTSANAFQIDPQCEHMRNKIGCTCAMQNGGYIKIRKNGVRWDYSRIYIDAVEACAKAAGGSLQQ